MRLALVVERFEAEGGGVESAVWELAHALAAAGDEVHVVARTGDASPAVTLHRVPVPTFWQPLRVLAFARRAQSFTERGGFDLVHAFCRALRQDVFHAGGGSHAHFMRRTYGPAGAALRRLSPRHALQLALERRIARDPRQLVQCVSEQGRDEWIARYGTQGERLCVVHYGVDSGRFRAQPAARAALRSELAAGDAPVWLLAGSGWRRKGLDTALRALARARDPDAHLWVAGGGAAGPWRRLAQQLGVGERVRFLGTRRDMASVYSGADGLLLPTRYDAFGLVCLEAAACGLPVVVSGTAGASELLTGAGLVVEDPEDADGFAAALDALASPERRAQLGAAGRRVAEAHSWAAQADALRGVYHAARGARAR